MRSRTAQRRAICSSWPGGIPLAAITPSLLVPDHVECRWFTKHKAARRARMRPIQAHLGEAIEEAADRCVRLQAREMHAYTNVRTSREGDLVMNILPAHVKAIRVGKEIWIAVRAGDRDGDELAASDRCVAERYV